MTELAEIVDTLEFLGDWDARYQYLMDLGEQLPPMPESFKTDANHVKPCMSTVHVAALPSPDAGCIRYLGDCDTAIIKGVLAVLISLCSDHSNEQIQALDMDEIFRQLQLDEHLSPSRHVGVYAIFDLMKKQAGRIAAESSAGCSTQDARVAGSGCLDV